MSAEKTLEEEQCTKDLAVLFADNENVNSSVKNGETECTSETFVDCRQDNISDISMSSTGDNFENCIGESVPSNVENGMGDKSENYTSGISACVENSISGNTEDFMEENPSGSLVENLQPKDDIMDNLEEKLENDIAENTDNNTENKTSDNFNENMNDNMEDCMNADLNRENSEENGGEDVVCDEIMNSEDNIEKCVDDSVSDNNDPVVSSNDNMEDESRNYCREENMEASEGYSVEKDGGGAGDTAENSLEGSVKESLFDVLEEKTQIDASGDAKVIDKNNITNDDNEQNSIENDFNNVTEEAVMNESVEENQEDLKDNNTDAAAESGDMYELEDDGTREDYGWNDANDGVEGREKDTLESGEDKTAENVIEGLIESVIDKVEESVQDMLLENVKENELMCDEVNVKETEECVKGKIGQNVSAVEDGRVKVNMENISENVNNEDITDKVNKEDNNEKFNSEDIGEKVSEEDMSEKVNNEDISEKVNNEDITEKVNNEDISDKVNKEDISVKVNNEYISDEVDMKNTNEKVNKEGISDKACIEDISGKVNNEDINDKINDEDSKEDISEKVNKEDVSEKVNMKVSSTKDSGADNLENNKNEETNDDMEDFCIKIIDNETGDVSFITAMDASDDNKQETSAADESSKLENLVPVIQSSDSLSVSSAEDNDGDDLCEEKQHHCCQRCCVEFDDESECSIHESVCLFDRPPTYRSDEYYDPPEPPHDLYLFLTALSIHSPKPIESLCELSKAVEYGSVDVGKMLTDEAGLNDRDAANSESETLASGLESRSADSATIDAGDIRSDSIKLFDESDSDNLLCKSADVKSELSVSVTEDNMSAVVKESSSSVDVSMNEISKVSEPLLPLTPRRMRLSRCLSIVPSFTEGSGVKNDDETAEPAKWLMSPSKSLLKLDLCSELGRSCMETTLIEVMGDVELVFVNENIRKMKADRKRRISKCNFSNMLLSEVAAKLARKDSYVFTADTKKVKQDGKPLKNETLKDNVTHSKIKSDVNSAVKLSSSVAENKSVISDSVIPGDTVKMEVDRNDTKPVDEGKKLNDSSNMLTSTDRALIDESVESKNSGLDEFSQAVNEGIDSERLVSELLLDVLMDVIKSDLLSSVEGVAEKEDESSKIQEEIKQLKESEEAKVTEEGENGQLKDSKQVARETEPESEECKGSEEVKDELLKESEEVSNVEHKASEEAKVSEEVKDENGQLDDSKVNNLLDPSSLEEVKVSKEVKVTKELTASELDKSSGEVEASEVKTSVKTNVSEEVKDEQHKDSEEVTNLQEIQPSEVLQTSDKVFKEGKATEVSASSEMVNASEEAEASEVENSEETKDAEEVKDSEVMEVTSEEVSQELKTLEEAKSSEEVKDSEVNTSDEVSQEVETSEEMKDFEEFKSSEKTEESKGSMPSEDYEISAEEVNNSEAVKSSEMFESSEEMEVKASIEEAVNLEEFSGSGSKVVGEFENSDAVKSSSEKFAVEASEKIKDSEEVKEEKEKIKVSEDVGQPISESSAGTAVDKSGVNNELDELDLLISRTLSRTENDETARPNDESALGNDESVQDNTELGQPGDEFVQSKEDLTQASNELALAANNETVEPAVESVLAKDESEQPSLESAQANDELAYVSSESVQVNASVPDLDAENKMDVSLDEEFWKDGEKVNGITEGDDLRSYNVNIDDLSMEESDDSSGLETWIPAYYEDYCSITDRDIVKYMISSKENESFATEKHEQKSENMQDLNQQSPWISLEHLARYCHLYKFSKQQRLQFYGDSSIRLRWGLKSRRSLKSCFVLLEKLTRQEIDDWRSSERLRLENEHFKLAHSTKSSKASKRQKVVKVKNSVKKQPVKARIIKSVTKPVAKVKGRDNAKKSKEVTISGTTRSGKTRELSSVRTSKVVTIKKEKRYGRSGTDFLKHKLNVKLFSSNMKPGKSNVKWPTVSTSKIVSPKNQRSMRNSTQNVTKSSIGNSKSLNNAKIQKVSTRSDISQKKFGNDKFKQHALKAVSIQLDDVSIVKSEVLHSVSRRGSTGKSGVVSGKSIKTEPFVNTSPRGKSVTVMKAIVKLPDINQITKASNTSMQRDSRSKISDNIQRGKQIKNEVPKIIEPARSSLKRKLSQGSIVESKPKLLRSTPNSSFISNTISNKNSSVGSSPATRNSVATSKSIGEKSNTTRISDKFSPKISTKQTPKSGNKASKASGSSNKKKKGAGSKNVIAISSDDETDVDEPSTPRTSRSKAKANADTKSPSSSDNQSVILFRCHICHDELTCTSNAPDTIKSHYKTEHNITNIDIVYSTGDDGKLMLTILQTQLTPQNSPKKAKSPRDVVCLTSTPEKRNVTARNATNSAKSGNITKAAASSAKAATNSAKVATNIAKTATNSAKAATNLAKPAANSTKAATNTAKAATNTGKADTNSAKPTQQTTPSTMVKFRCHICSAELTEYSNASGTIKNHYSAAHGIDNIEMIYKKQNGKTVLTILQGKNPASGKTPTSGKAPSKTSPAKTSRTTAGPSSSQSSQPSSLQPFVDLSWKPETSQGNRQLSNLTSKLLNSPKLAKSTPGAKKGTSASKSSGKKGKGKNRGKNNAGYESDDSDIVCLD